jgi:uncharacterized protein YijF (DUF1287 family)
MRRQLLIAGLASGALFFAAWRAVAPDAPPARPPVLKLRPKTIADRIVNGAKEEALRGVVYDASYQRISYPGGDVASDRGACTDVVIRALRHAGMDLQALMHQDMERHFALYPHSYGLRGPDANIDHRRCRNHLVFFRRFGKTLPLGTAGRNADSWQPGDLVYCRLPGGLLHTGVCSDERNAHGLPLVIHNMSRAAQQDVLEQWEIIGHFRYPAGGRTPPATPFTEGRRAARPARSLPDSAVPGGRSSQTDHPT